MRKLVCLLLLFLLPFGASAWWARGHMVVAALAYLEMSKNTQEQVTELLKHHPEYERLWKGEYVKYQKKMDLGVFLMMRASVWADEIKNRKHPFNKESHGHWHYITYRIEFPNKHDMTLPSGENVVWGIQEAQKKVMDTKLDKAQRAISMAWLIHLVGDIHQPLHCGSEFSDVYPKGDLGGNKQFVRPKGQGIKLHGLWDSALGKKSHHRKSIHQAKVLQRTKTGMNFSAKLDAVAWSKESFELAISDVHQKGELKTSTEANTAPKLPKSYLSNMKVLANKKAVHAGVRLAESVKGLTM